MELQIKNLESLINQIDKNKKYVDSKIYKLTEAGDNYGSLMLGVSVSLKNGQIPGESSLETLNLVAKMLPQSKFLQAMFNSERTFRNEVGFYQIIAPCLREFQKEQGLVELFDAFPAFYGARLSLDPQNKKVDEDAVLLIKNIKDDGFGNVDRTLGFDYDQTKLILEKMAELHATTLAFRLHKPDVFEKKLGELFEEYKIFDIDSDTAIANAQKLVNSFSDWIKDDEFCVKYLDKVQKIIYDSFGSPPPTRNSKKALQGQEPFFSFVHSDMWSNNIMVKSVNGKTIDVKFVDFQIYEYSSLTRDVVFFLFTSVQFPVIQKYCDDFLTFYYNTFLNLLIKFNCDLSPYSYEGFIDDMKRFLVKYGFSHIMLMLPPIYATKEDVKETHDIVNSDDMISQRQNISNILIKKKAIFIVQEFIKRGWIG